MWPIQEGDHVGRTRLDLCGLALCQTAHFTWAMLQGVYLPPDIQYRFERAMGNVLMVSGSDEHGTPITVTAETQGITPQAVVDQYHEMNLKALLDLGCSWSNHPRSKGRRIRWCVV